MLPVEIIGKYLPVFFLGPWLAVIGLIFLHSTATYLVGANKVPMYLPIIRISPMKLSVEATAWAYSASFVTRQTPMVGFAR